MKQRKYPKNPDCPLSKKEKIALDKALSDIEWKAYLPLKHLTSAWSEAIVTDYNKHEIEIEVKSGVDSQGSSYTYDLTIKRSDFSLVV
jgi:hypothetical protein